MSAVICTPRSWPCRLGAAPRSRSSPARPPQCEEDSGPRATAPPAPSSPPLPRQPLCQVPSVSGTNYASLAACCFTPSRCLGRGVPITAPHLSAPRPGDAGSPRRPPLACGSATGRAGRRAAPGSVALAPNTRRGAPGAAPASRGRARSRCRACVSEARGQLCSWKEPGAHRSQTRFGAGPFRPPACVPVSGTPSAPC